MHKYDFFTIGGGIEDITIYTNDTRFIDNHNDLLAQKLMAFEYGAKLGVEKSFSTFGGGAANAAVCFSKLGFKTAALIALGEDNRGQRMIENLKKFKVNTNFIQQIKGAETGFTFIIVGADKEHISFTSRGANSALTIGAKEIKEINQAKWAYLTSLSGKWQQVLKNIFNTKAMIVWNPGRMQLIAGYQALAPYLAKTEILTLNKDEAIELVLSDKKNKIKDSPFFNDIHNLLKIIKSYGPKIVVITNGIFGAYGYDGEKIYFQKILRAKKTVDTTGAGDAFGATFAAGIGLFKGDIKKAMHAAIKNAASVVEKQGAQNGLLGRKGII